MSKIVIIGAGAMGTAFSLPCLDNNHDINIVGTHLEDNFIETFKKNKNFHPGLNTEIPNQVKNLSSKKIKEKTIDTSKNLSSISDEIEKLASLKEKGLLTDEEFSAAKAKLLNK